MLMRLFLFFIAGSVLLVLLLFVYVAFSYWLMCRRLGVPLRGGFRSDESVLGYRFAVGGVGDYGEGRFGEAAVKEAVAADERAVAEDEAVVKQDESAINDSVEDDRVVVDDEECVEKSFDVIRGADKDAVQSVEIASVSDVDGVVDVGQDEQGVCEPADSIGQDEQDVRESGADSRFILWQGTEYSLSEFREILESMRLVELRLLYSRLGGTSGSSLKKRDLVFRILSLL